MRLELSVLVEIHKHEPVPRVDLSLQKYRIVDFFSQLLAVKFLVVAVRDVIIAHQTLWTQKVKHFSF